MLNFLTRAGCLLAVLSGLTIPLAKAQAPTADFPNGADWALVARPAGSIIAATSHSDMDEFVVPMGKAVGAKFAKSVSAQGAVERLAYSGPVATSTLQNMARITEQLTSKGFQPVFVCVKTECGGYEMAELLVTPLANTLSGSEYMNFTLQSFGAYTGDVRYTTFRRGTEYLCVLAALNPGQYSSVLLIDVGGKVR